MAGLPARDDLRAGQAVEMETKADQGAGRLTSGVVKRILTSGRRHPYGVKVMLEDGRMGRVKRVTGA